METRKERMDRIKTGAPGALQHTELVKAIKWEHGHLKEGLGEDRRLNALLDELVRR